MKLFKSIAALLLLLAVLGCNTTGQVALPPADTPEQGLAIAKVTYAGALSTLTKLYWKGVLTPEDAVKIDDYTDKIDAAIAQADGFILAHAGEDLLKPQVATVIDLVARLTELVATYVPPGGTL